MRYTLVELKRAILSISFLLSVITMAIVMVYCVNETIIRILNNELPVSDIKIAELCHSVLSSDTALFAIPIVATVPFSCSILDDISSHFVKELLVRVSKKNYACSKITALVISAGFTAVLSILLFETIMCILCIVSGEMPTLNADTLLLSIELMGKYFIFFAMWGLFGAILGTETDSKCVVYASPFILYYVLVIIKSRYLHTVDAIDPRLWCSGNSGVITVAVLLAVLYIFGYAMIRRRLKDV